MERIRRKYPRKKVCIPVEYKVEGAACQTHAWTLGGGGLFLGLSETIPVGAELTVLFRPAPHLPVIEARAKVRYAIADEGVGIEFTDIKPEERDKIVVQIGHRMSEKRRFPRAPLAVAVEFDGGSALGASKDVSVGGMFIESNEPVLAFKNHKLSFKLDDGGPPIVTAVEIRYVVGNHGIGVEFVGLAPADRKRIETFVNRGEQGL